MTDEIEEVKEQAVVVYKGEATVEFDLSSMLPTVGTLEITEEQKAILFAPVDELDVEIRPDGVFFLPWSIYVQRLHKAFPMAWGLIPQGLPKVNGNLVIWGFHLIIKGVYMGFALGENNYQPTNRMMSYGDCVEGAKSNAITRLCKQAGISLELWDKSYYEDWKKKYAEQFTDKNSRLLWRKKAEFVRHPLGQEATPAPLVDETGRTDGLVDGSRSPRMITIWNGKEKLADEKIGKETAAKTAFNKEFSGHKYFKHPKHFDQHLEKHFAVKHAEDLTWEQLDAMHRHINNVSHDGRWYQQEKAEVGWPVHNATKTLYEAKGAMPLFEEITNHYGPKLATIPARWGVKMKEISEAIGVVYDLPLNDEAKKEIFALLDKELA